MTENTLYEAYFVDGLKEGYARYISWCPEQEGVYEGEWRKDLRSGFGEEVWKNGEKFRGESEEGMRHGIGIWTFADGRTRLGTWEKGMKEGWAIYTDKDFVQAELWLHDVVQKEVDLEE